MISGDFKALLRIWADKMLKNKDELIKLDSVVGDSDLGLTMSDGFEAAAKAAESSDEQDIGKLLYAAGKAMSTAVPSTMGTLMASGLMQAGKVLKGLTELPDNEISKFFEAYMNGISHRGKAQVGEKTVIDGLYPAVEKLKECEAQGMDMNKSAEKAAAAAHEGYLSTKGMLAKHGRAAGRGEASRELLDPGAAVADLLFEGYKQYANK